MDPLRRQCAGTKPRPFVDFPAGYWFTPKDAKDLKVTYCGFCVERMGLGGGQLPTVALSSGSISCDAFAISEDYYETRKGAFRVDLLQSPKLGDEVRHLLVPSERTKAKEAGVGIYGLPTQSDYAVRIQMEQPGPFSEQDMCFTIESFYVGERKVKVFDTDKTVYCSGAITVKGFTPGGTDSFRFVSVSEGEKQRREVDAAVMANYNEDNVIRITLQRHRRVPAEKPMYACNAFGFGAKKSMSRGGGGPDLFGMDLLGGPTFGSESAFQKLGGSSASFGSSAASAPASQVLSGGTTISGGHEVGKIATTTTRDIFSKIGEPMEIVLQLACFQSPQEKELDNKRAALHEAGYDYFTHTKNAMQKRVTELLERLRVIDTHLMPLQMALLNLDAADAQRLVDPEEKTATVKRLLLEDARREQDAHMLPLQ